MDPVSQKVKVHQILVQFYGNAAIFPNTVTDWGFLVIFRKHTAKPVTLRHIHTQCKSLALFKSLSNVKAFYKSFIFLCKVCVLSYISSGHADYKWLRCYQQLLSMSSQMNILTPFKWRRIGNHKTTLIISHLQLLEDFGAYELHKRGRQKINWWQAKKTYFDWKSKTNIKKLRKM